MVTMWIILIAANFQKWRIAESVAQKLAALAADAKSALDTAKNESTRTPVATARCKEAFDALIAEMRDVKRRYFLIPPLTEADFVALGLKPPDISHTPSGVPTAQVTVETFLVGRHELGIRIVYVSGSPDDPANKGYRVWYSVVAHGETPPANPDDLRKSFFTQRKKDVVQFEYADSGKKAYIAVQIESGGGKKGGWGPMVLAVIP
jgi:hypothetical protein